MRDYEDISKLREKIIGLGETSMKKSYYPDLQARLEELNRFKALVNAVSDILIIIRTDDLIIMDVNDATCNLFEITIGDIKDKSLDDLCKIPFFAFIKDLLLLKSDDYNSVSSREGIDSNYVLRTKTDYFIYLDINIKSSVFAGVEYAIIIAKEANNRIEMLRELQESERRYRELVEFLPLIFFEIDNHGRFSYINPYGLSMFGYTEEEAYGMTIFDIIIPHDHERAIKNIQKRLRGENIPSQEYQLCTKDKRVIPTLIETRTIFMENKGVGLRGVGIDLTERKQLERHQLKSAKIDALSVLASGLAHDFNNILNSISGNISLAMMSLNENSPSYEKLLKAEIAISKAKDLNDKLFMFSKETKTPHKVFSIRGVIEDAIAISIHSPKVSCISEYEDNLSPIYGDPVQIGQVFQNLIINAIQAMPDGGTIRINARNIQLADENPMFLPAGNYVEVEVSDEGKGIPQEYIDRIFEPYFTTKESGSGLGLATVYNIVKNHGGIAQVESQYGVGTTFKIYLRANMTYNEREMPVSSN
ncbi:MAG: ATP-binding protein [Thermodesulfovibrionales bacterium]